MFEINKRFMLRFIIILLPLLLITFSISAQNPLWFAEVVVEVTTEFEHERDHRNYQLLRRPQSEAAGRADEYAHDPMGAKVMAAILEGRLRAYKDENLQSAYSPAELSQLLTSSDTVAIFDSETYEERIQITENEANPTDFTSIRLDLNLAFQPDGSMVQAISCGSFLIKPYDELGNVLTDGPRIYFPVSTAKRPLKFHRRNWNLIDQHMINVPVAQMGLYPNNQLSTEEMVSQLMEMVIRGRNDDFVGTIGDYQVLSLDDRQALRGTVDTIVTYSPATYEEQKEVVVNVYDPASIEKIRLLQYWAWDEKRAVLTVLPLGYAPIKAVYDEYDNFLYSLPLFYHVEERFRE